MMGHRNSQLGFTLQELVLVVMLLGILSAVLIIAFIDFRDDSKNAVTRDELLAIRKAILGDARVASGGTYSNPGYMADMGSVPASLQDLVINPSTGNTTQTYDPLSRIGWRGPYVDDGAVSDYSKDAWGHTYQYSAGSRFIRSFGPNGVDNSGGGDDITVSF